MHKIMDLGHSYKFGNVKKLKDVNIPDKFFNKIILGFKEIDEIFGGVDAPGIIPGTSLLLTGMPGAGKSTLCLQIADRMQDYANKDVLYNVGEESEYMFKMAANRIKVNGNFDISQFQEIDSLINHTIKTNVEILFVDSLQSLSDNGLFGRKLLTSCVYKFVSLSKKYDVTVFIIGHITKGGVFAGPQTIKHATDAHAHFKYENDVRTFEMLKNRFGPANIPYELTLGVEGICFSQQQSKDEKVVERENRKNIYTNLAKELLISGRSLNGYSYQDVIEIISLRKEYGDISGSYWRGILNDVSATLRSEGYIVGKKKIDRRESLFLSM